MPSIRFHPNRSLEIFTNKSYVNHTVLSLDSCCRKSENMTKVKYIFLTTDSGVRASGTLPVPPERNRNQSDAGLP